MRRYKEFIQPITDINTLKQRYESMRYPEFEVRSTDQYIITKELERLDLIAYDWYNDTTKWWIIARANNLPGGTFRVKAGTRLRIPYPLSEFELVDKITNNQF